MRSPEPPSASVSVSNQCLCLSLQLAPHTRFHRTQFVDYYRPAYPLAPAHSLLVTSSTLHTEHLEVVCPAHSTVA
jgi:hypothetical protein